MSHLNNFRSVSSNSELMSLLPDIRELADKEGNAVGFLPEIAYAEAAKQEKIIALVDESGNKSTFAGYLLHSGVYPNAKVQQIATRKSYRNRGIASAILETLVSKLEKLGFITLRADVADDLDSAKRFYQKNQFYPTSIKAGGNSRKRKIIVHIRELKTDTLFYKAEDIKPTSSFRNRTSLNSIYTLDLNIFLDLAKNRQHTSQANKLFSAALKHEIRIAVARELHLELQRTSKNVSDDQILKLAFQLPQLPKVSEKSQQALTEEIHKIVFVDEPQRKDDSEQAWSDASHLAHAVLARSKAFVTRDSELIRASDELILRFGIDVISLDELVRLLPPDQGETIEHTRVGQRFIAADGTPDGIESYLATNNILQTTIDEFSRRTDSKFDRWQRCIINDMILVGIAVLLSPRTPDRVSRLLVHCDEDNPDAQLFVDHLVDSAIRAASHKAVSAIELELPLAQPTLLQYIVSKGFTRIINKSCYNKFAFGRPISANRWENTVRETRHRTGLILPQHIPTKRKNIQIEKPNKAKFWVTRTELEELFEPTIIAWRDRKGVITPIKASYSEELLGVGSQYSLLANKDVRFLSRRSYVGDPRSYSIMIPDTPILFYESKGRSTRQSGEGAVVAVARIIDSVVRRKNDVSQKELRQTVVDNVEDFSASKEVLVTSFDNIFGLPNPVRLDSLKRIGAADDSNLVTSRPISGSLVSKIIDLGWPDE